MADMELVGDDLLLVAVREDGTLAVREKLRFGVAGAQLVTLAARGRVDIQKGRIIVMDASPTGDPLLDAALGSMAERKRPPTAKAWVARNRPGLVESYLDRLATAGTITARHHRVLGMFSATRWDVTDPARRDQARARLDAIATGAGDVDLAQAALAGLADAIGLAALYYRGKERKRFKTAAQAHVDAAGTSDAVRRAAEAANAAAISAATLAAISATNSAACSGGGPTC